MDETEKAVPVRRKKKEEAEDEAEHKGPEIVEYTNNS
jgi:hypothetical protein